MNKNLIKHIEKDIIEQLKFNQQVIVGIDGMCAAGKSSLAAYLKDKYFAQVIHMDDFFLQDHQRTEERLNDIGGHIDYERFEREIVHAIQQNEDIVYHQYNCQDKTMTLSTIKKDFHLLIIEGAYAFRPSFRSIYDLTYLMLIDSDKQKERLKERNKAMYDQFINEWIPKENSYIEMFDLKAYADKIMMI